MTRYRVRIRDCGGGQWLVHVPAFGITTYAYNNDFGPTAVEAIRRCAGAAEEFGLDYVEEVIAVTGPGPR